MSDAYDGPRTRGERIRVQGKGASWPALQGVRRADPCTEGSAPEALSVVNVDPRSTRLLNPWHPIRIPSACVVARHVETHVRPCKARPSAKAWDPTPLAPRAPGWLARVQERRPGAR